MHIVLCTYVCVCVLLRTECLGKSSTTVYTPSPIVSLNQGHKLMEEELSHHFVDVDAETSEFM